MGSFYVSVRLLRKIAASTGAFRSVTAEITYGSAFAGGFRKFEFFAKVILAPNRSNALSGRRYATPSSGASNVLGDARLGRSPTHEP